MTGKELIIYILENGLENEEIFKDGTFIGFMTVEQAAVKYEVGIATIGAWIATRTLDAVKIGGVILIPNNVENPKERMKNESNTTNVCCDCDHDYVHIYSGYIR